MQKIVKFMGGLGNQMFQYAFSLALKHRYNCEMYYDYSFFDECKKDTTVTKRAFELEIFGLQCKESPKELLEKIVYPKNSLQKRFPKFFNITFKREHGHGNFEKNLIEYPNYIYYEGYFQNENYFKNIRNEILNEFTLKEPLDEKNLSVLNEIKKQNSISIHIRRGDYVTLENAKIHGVCSLEYYKKAIEYITKHVENPHFYLFSDETDWVEENLKINYPFTIVDLNQEKGYLDMELMKNCKHNIIANSSFSWWGAWLNQNPDKIVIAPKQWTTREKNNKIICKEWVKIS